MRRDGEGNLLEVIGNNNSFTILLYTKELINRILCFIYQQILNNILWAKKNNRHSRIVYIYSYIHFLVWIPLHLRSNFKNNN